ncbi:MAG: hypothetical protein J6Q85_05935 [Clostridia bacterium]|nr:hypothetical protein [Clostridia bacterium]
MAKKQRKFVDDGWAIWTDGDDTCTIYLHDWLNPKGDSYVDLAVRIRGVKLTTRMRVYIPFAISREEINDVSTLFNDTKILQAIFGSACIIDYKKNDFTSEIAYLGKTVDIVHVGTLDYSLSSLADGTLMDIDLKSIQPSIDNDEAYFIWRMPHRSLDKLFKSRVGAGSLLSRFRDLVTSPVLSEKHGYSVRINEPRLLPEQITRVGSFHRQKLKKAIITISISEDYDLNDDGCYRIRRLEQELYKNYIPNSYDTDDVITYQWHQDRETNSHGQFNFYYNITKNAVDGASMTVYMILLMLLAVAGEILGDFAKTLLGLQ